MAEHKADVRFYRRLSWLDLHRGHISLAVATLEAGLANVTAGSDELLIPLGDLLVQLGETKRADAIVATLSAKAGELPKVQANYLRARLAMRADDWAKALDLLTGLRTETVALPGLATQTNLLLAIAHRRTGNAAAERECLLLVLNRDPNHVPARVALGQSYLVAGDVGGQPVFDGRHRGDGRSREGRTTPRPRPRPAAGLGRTRPPRDGHGREIRPPVE
jgi:hypothetical protein